MRSPFDKFNAAACALAAVTLLGCGHTHVAKDAPLAEPEASAPRQEAAAQARPRTSVRAKEPGAPMLFTSPAATLAPGAVEKIQTRLVASGALPKDDAGGELDGPTTAALRDFQRAHHLPATGVPDDATVGALGLRPEDVFRRSDP
jgi:Putative peptidoglycan binding domain